MQSTRAWNLDDRPELQHLIPRKERSTQEICALGETTECLSF